MTSATLRARHRASRAGVAGGAALVAASAWYGAVGLAFDLLAFPDRLTRRLPFGSAAAGGIALAVIVAVPYTVLTVLAWRGDRRASVMCRACGLVLIAWILVELAVIREFSFLQPILTAVGVAFAAAGERR